MKNIIALLINFFEGRGTYPIFMVIVSWIYLFVIVLFLLLQVILLIFRVKYDNKEFENDIGKKNDELK